MSVRDVGAERDRGVKCERTAWVTVERKTERKE